MKTTLEDLTAYIEAIQYAIDQLKPKGREEHALMLARLPPQAILTRDMCPCGETTGAHKGETCKRLAVLRRLRDELQVSAEYLRSMPAKKRGKAK